MQLSVQEGGRRDSTGQRWYVAKDSVALSYSRIINFDKLLQYTSELNQHSSSYYGLLIQNGKVRLGLALFLWAVFKVHAHNHSIETF